MTNNFLKQPVVRNWWNLGFYIITLPFLIMGRVIRRNAGIWIFGCRMGYRDNARYLYEYTQNRRSDVRAIWIYKRTAIRILLPKSAEAYHAYGLRGLYYQYIAGVHVFSTGRGDFAKPTSGGALRVQLWHGTPLKKIMNDAVNENVVSRIPSLNTLASWFARGYIGNYDYLTAPSPIVAERLSSAFNMPKTRILLTGYPRLDTVLTTNTSDSLRTQLGLTPATRIVSYLPTWRAQSKVISDILNELLTGTMDSYLQHNEAVLLIALHPLDRELAKKYSNRDAIRVLKDSTIETSQLLAQTDILVTDYSGVLYDYSVLSRPIIYLATDLTNYKRARGLYDDYHELAGSMFCSTIAEFRMRLRDCLATPAKYYMSHEMQKFNTFVDTENCQRAFEAIFKKANDKTR